MNQRTKEPQYQACLDLAGKQRAVFGLMSNQVWHDDPRRLAFVLSRYKFVAKMLSGMGDVLEVGCADAFGTRLVLQEVRSVTATDFDPVFVEDVKRRMDPDWKFDCLVHDMLKSPMVRPFDGVYAIDVIEHIAPADEDRFVSNLADSLQPGGVCIIGTPSLESQAYASPASNAGHINCKTGSELKKLMSKRFANVFVFSMNDEVVHTGFDKLAHYFFALCCGKI